MMRSFYYGMREDDVEKFQRFAWTLMRLGVVEYMELNVWEERVNTPSYWDGCRVVEDEYKIDHVSVSVMVDEDSHGDYEIR